MDSKAKRRRCLCLFDFFAVCFIDISPVDGALKENETGADITFDNGTVGSHTVHSVVTVGNIPYFNTKFFESETYTYGIYI